MLAHAIQTAGTRDYVFRLATIIPGADGSFAIAGLVRQSQPVAVLGGDSYGALTAAVTLHLVAIESD